MSPQIYMEAQRVLDSEFAYLVPHFLTPDRIAQMLDLVAEWEPALVNVGHGKQKYIPGVRLCDRAMVLNGEMAREMWKEIEHLIPKDTSFGVPVGLNPMFRFLKYGTGEYFKPHYDKLIIIVENIKKID